MSKSGDGPPPPHQVDTSASEIAIEEGGKTTWNGEETAPKRGEINNHLIMVDVIKMENRRGNLATGAERLSGSYWFDARIFKSTILDNLIELCVKKLFGLALTVSDHSIEIQQKRSLKFVLFEILNATNYISESVMVKQPTCNKKGLKTVIKPNCYLGNIIFFFF